MMELRVPQLRRLFNQMDPSPFHDRDLDPSAEEFIVAWSRELPREAPLSLVVHLGRGPGLPEEGRMLREAVHQYFNRRSAVNRQQLRQIFRRGRISLAIGICFLVLALTASQLLATRMAPGGMSRILSESLIIGGWVAMWRPLEVFLYDWWPVLADRRLFDRLAAMPVELRYEPGGDPAAARYDWPLNEEPASASTMAGSAGARDLRV